MKKYDNLYDRLIDAIKIDEDTDCWIWQHRKNEKGYGLFHHNGHKGYRVHRAMYEYVKGEIPKDKIVCHKCDNPSCINPDHLWLGTHTENIRDREEKGRGRCGGGIIGIVLSKNDIRDIYHSKECSKELACKYNITERYVRRIKSRKCWAELDMEQQLSLSF